MYHIITHLQLVQSAALLTNRGVIHQFMGDVVNAMRDYQQAVAMEPDYFLAHFNIGNVLFQQRHFKQVKINSVVICEAILPEIGLLLIMFIIKING